MAIITWDSSLSVDVSEVDRQHKKLVDLINELHDAMRVGKAKEVMSKVIKELVDYAVQHFSLEEKKMQEYQYENYTQHKVEHDQFVAKAAALQRDFNSGKVTVTLDTMTFLKDWLTKHIMGTDKKYVVCFHENGFK